VQKRLPEEGTDVKLDRPCFRLAQTGAAVNLYIALGGGLR
jgi:hypothetical protein